MADNIGDGALAGALAAIQKNRANVNANPLVGPATTSAAAANAFAQQFLTANNALTTPMDGATTNIALVCYAASYAEMSQRAATSVTSTDYATAAAAAVANAKAASINLT